MDELQELKDNNIEDFDKAVVFALRAQASPEMKMLVEKVYSNFRSLAVDGNNLSAHVRAQAYRIEHLERESNNLINTVESLIEGMNAHSAMIAKLEGMTAHFQELERVLVKQLTKIEGRMDLLEEVLDEKTTLKFDIPGPIRPRGYDPEKSCETCTKHETPDCMMECKPPEYILYSPVGFCCDLCTKDKVDCHGQPAAGYRGCKTWTPKPTAQPTNCPDCKQDEADKTPSLACKGCEGQLGQKEGEVWLRVKLSPKGVNILYAGAFMRFTKDVNPDDLITVPPQDEYISRRKYQKDIDSWKDKFIVSLKLLDRAHHFAGLAVPMPNSGLAEINAFIKKHGGSHD